MFGERQQVCEAAYEAMLRHVQHPEVVQSDASSAAACSQCQIRQATQRCGALDWASVCDDCASKVQTMGSQQDTAPRQETPAAAQEQLDKPQMSLFARPSSQSKLVNFVHGEVTFTAVTRFLSLATPGKDDEFCDLGCGAGKAIVMAAMLWPFKRCWGMDLAQTQLAEGKQLTAQYNAWFSDKQYESISHTATPPSQVSVEHGDILLSDWSSADVVYICSTCFDEDQMARLGQLALKLKTGARVITMDKQLLAVSESATAAAQETMSGDEVAGLEGAAGSFVIIGECECEMTWGTARAFVQRKVE
jgi:hypothetical protein